MRSLEVGLPLVFLRADGRKEDLAGDVDVQLRDLPVMGCNLAAFDLKRASLVQSAEYTAKNFHIVHHASADGSDAIVALRDDDLTFHGGEDASLHVGWLEVWIALELAVDASSEAKAEPAAHLEAQVKAPPAADLASEVNVPPWPTTPIPLSPASVSEAKLNADLARLMNITLGDIFGLLQAALDKDPDKHPESREHVPGWTGTQAEARAPAVKTDEPAVQTSA